MALTPSTMLPLGTEAPAFTLASTEGTVVSLKDFDRSPVLVVLFMCNHCPYVKHLHGGLVDFGRGYQAKGVAIVGINSNNAETHPADSFEKMIQEKRTVGYPFPYLYDPTQAVAKAYAAACTPDFYVFDAARRLRYRGQFDDSRPGSAIPVTGRDLRAAVDALLAGGAPAEAQRPSLGCNIKWKAGNEPAYFHS